MSMQQKLTSAKLPPSTGKDRKVRQLGRLTRDRVALVAAAAGPLAVAATLTPWRGSPMRTDAALVLVLVVVAVAADGYRIAGLIAAVSAGVWFDVLLTKPYGRLTITDPADVRTTVLLLLVERPSRSSPFGDATNMRKSAGEKATRPGSRTPPDPSSRMPRPRGRSTPSPCN